MIIALDYDGTITADPQLWRSFTYDAQTAGHTVYVVTMRYPSECTEFYGFDVKGFALAGIIATGRTAKRAVCEAHGIKIDVWIDDNPKAVEADAAVVWPFEHAQYPEG